MQIELALKDTDFERAKAWLMSWRHYQAAIIINAAFRSIL